MTGIIPSDAYKVRYKTIDWDIRTTIDEPLHPERFDDADLEEMEKELGTYAAAGQLQQRPAPRGGGMFKVEKFNVIPEPPPVRFVDSYVRYWDKAGTEGGGKRTAGVLMAKMKPDYPGTGFVILDCRSGQWATGRREQTIRQTAELDGKTIDVWVEQEGGSGGKESAESTVANLAGFVCKADKVTGSKEVRAEPYAAQVEIGNVSLVQGDWVRDFIDEHEPFPMGKFSDRVDGASGAFNKLNEPKKKKRGGVWGSEYTKRER
jgi:predicted phage terminase large subunit-like protein